VIPAWENTSEERIWQWQQDELRVRVHRHIHYPDDMWLLSCRQLDISCHELEAKDIVEAKLEGLTVAHERAERYMHTLGLGLPAKGGAS
jgi:hypothetical protein